ncbi:11208_t:CDS:1, partial [Gigaspora rosea]
LLPKEAKGLNKLSTQDLDTNSVEIERKNEDLWAVANTDNTVNG